MDQSPPTDILQDVQQEIQLVPVSPGIRFANFIIDVIVYYALTFAVGMVWAVIAYSNTAYGVSSPTMGLGITYLIAYSVLIIYYTLIEGVSKGRSLGKLATSTIVVKEDGSAITFKDALLRSLCRIIPFEPFSAFGYRPWHDTITKTMVIKKQR
jgi:uncharacterized RDD family membrane protein YckC